MVDVNWNHKSTPLRRNHLPDLFGRPDTLPQTSMPLSMRLSPTLGWIARSSYVQWEDGCRGQESCQASDCLRGSQQQRQYWGTSECWCCWTWTSSQNWLLNRCLWWTMRRTFACGFAFPWDPRSLLAPGEQTGRGLRSHLVRLWIGQWRASLTVNNGDDATKVADGGW